MSYWSRNNGIHWRDASNNRLRRLAEERAYEIEPQMDDAETEHDGTIQVYFGSSCDEIRLGLTSSATSIFKYGYCVLLAYAIHLKTDLPLFLFTSTTKETGWSGHAGVINPETNKFIDIQGTHEIANVRNSFPNIDEGHEVTREEFLNLVISEEYRDEPFGFLDELEQLIVDHFADLVIEETKIKQLVTA